MMIDYHEYDRRDLTLDAWNQYKRLIADETDACYTEYDLECALVGAGQLNDTDRLRQMRGIFETPVEEEDVPARAPTQVLYDWEWGITAEEVRERIEELRHTEEDDDES